jgi:cyclic beta-1,2-glucan synthetase
MAEMGRHARAAQLLRMLSPVSHAETPEQVGIYQVEPYVIAADIYGEVPHVGRGGWTWYTGSAGWMFRVALESVLGFVLEGGEAIVLAPRIPDEWPEVSISYRLPGSQTRYELRVLNPDRQAAGVQRATLDGQPLATGEVAHALRIPLVDDGATHRVDVVLGRPA